MTGQRTPRGAIGTPLFASTRHRALIARTEQTLRRAGETLRRTGKDEYSAVTADQWASWLRLSLDDPEAAKPLFATLAELATAVADRPFLERALEDAISLTGADLGNIQLVQPLHGSLRIATASGFERDFLDYFAEVADSSSACGRAAFHRRQTVIADVNRDPDFAPHREIAAASGFRAVQSTPIVDPKGRLLGIISTHFRRARRPDDRQLQLVAWYAQRLGRVLSEGARLLRG